MFVLFETFLQKSIIQLKEVGNLNITVLKHCLFSAILNKEPKL